MAECTEYSQIIVSGAGTDIVNGTYIPAPGVVGSRGNTVFTKNGLNSYPRINVSGSDPGQWFIYSGVPFPSASTYNAPGGSYGTNNCPVGFVWTVGPFGSLPAPTVTGVTATVDPIAERDAKYATATEPGSARFRRLVGLGYV